jgi:transcriptional regulator with XRE-family HTH domain
MSQSLTDALRRAILTSKLSRYEIAKRSGVTEASLSRFAAGGSLRLETVDRLLDVLGLEIKPKTKAKGE